MKRFAQDVYSQVELPFTKTLNSTAIPVNTAILPIITKILHQVSVTFDQIDNVQHLNLFADLDL